MRGDDGAEVGRKVAGIRSKDGGGEEEGARGMG